MMQLRKEVMRGCVTRGNEVFGERVEGGGAKRGGGCNKYRRLVLRGERG